MRYLFVCTLLFVMASFTNAQPFTGDIYATAVGGSPARGTLYRINRNGQARQTGVTPGAARANGIAVTPDNQGILWTDPGGSTSSLVSRIYWLPNSRSQTSGNRVLFSTADYNIDELLVNQNGDVVFTGRDRSRIPPVTGIFKWRAGTSVSTIATTLALGVPVASLDGGIDVNVGTGNYLVATSDLQNGQVWDVADDGTVTSLITAPASPIGGARSLTQDKRDGTIYQGGFDWYGVIQNGVQVVQKPTGGTLTAYYYALRADRASVPDTSRRLYSLYTSLSSTTSGIHMVSSPKSNPTVTSTPVFGLFLNDPTSVAGMVFADEKNIGSRKAGPGGYVLNFNFPGEGGKQYVVGISASGYYPGLQLADGRNICLNPDALTFTSVNNLLKPYFDPGSGTLDASGNATGSIALGVDGLNVRIHIVVATVSGGNIDTVSDPYVMKL